MTCGCSGLSHGEDMYYVLPHVPDSMPFRQRLERWAELIQNHPQLSRFDAKQFVQDLPPSFSADVQSVRPVMERLMTNYKNSRELQDLEKKLGLHGNQEGHDQLLKDCDLAMENFFSGNWGHIKFLEYILMNNAIQMSDPSDFNDAVVRSNIQKCVDSTGGIVDIYSALGVKNYNWQLEDSNGQ